MTSLRHSDPPTDKPAGATCPDCEQGKHRGCTGAVLADSPEGPTWTTCACAQCTSWRDIQVTTITRRRFRTERHQGVAS